MSPIFCTLTDIALQKVGRDIADGKFARALELCVMLLANLEMACTSLKSKTVLSNIYSRDKARHESDRSKESRRKR
jgi:hypothetical protein